MANVKMEELARVQTVGPGGIGVYPPVPTEKVDKVSSAGLGKEELQRSANVLPHPGAVDDGAVMQEIDGAWSGGQGGGGSADIDLGVTDASVGDYLKVKSVDEDGKPTAWESEPVDTETIVEATDAWLEENVAQETGYALDSSLTMSNAAAPADKVGELKTAITKLDDEIFDYTSAVNTDAWTYNNNNAVTSNGDGTYNVGTSDYGTTAWGGNALIYPGTYKLFGSPYGLVFVSPNTAYTSAIVSNDTGVEKIVTITEAGMYYVGVRTGAKPSTSYVLTPYLIKVDNKLDEIDTEIDGLTTAVSDVEDKIDTVVQDNNLLVVNSQNLVHSAGDATLAFNLPDGFTATRVTAQNNMYGLIAKTQAKNTYRLKFKVISGTIASMYLCPTSEYNTGASIANRTDLSSGDEVDITFTAVTGETSVWFNQKYDVPIVQISNIFIGDDILRYNKYIMDYSGTEITVFNKILCIGDSLTEGTFNYESGGSTNNVVAYTKYSYPTFLHKLTGCDVSNYGYGGDTAEEWYTRYASEDLSGYDACIIMLGVNDAVENVGVTSFRTGMTNIINKVKNENEGIKVFVATIIPCFSDYDAKYDNYIAEAKRLVEEDFTDAFLIDINKYSECKRFTYYVQGHLTAIGYEQLAKEFYTLISYTIHNNLQAFRNVQFIGTSYTYPDFANS